jgi:hypothetical protein
MFIRPGSLLAGVARILGDKATVSTRPRVAQLFMVPPARDGPALRRACPVPELFAQLVSWPFVASPTI